MQDIALLLMLISSILSGKTDDTLKLNFWNQGLEAQSFNSYWLMIMSKQTQPHRENTYDLSLTNIRPRKTLT